MNEIILIGRLAQDPEIRYTQTSGKAVAQFNLAVNRRVRQGEHPQADFIPIVVWDKLAEVVGNNLSKGRKIAVRGRLQIRPYETNDGQKRRATEVIANDIEFLDYKDGNNSAASSSVKTNTGNGAGSNGFDFNSFGTEVFPEEEIPF